MDVNTLQVKRNIDIVFCIDGTGSMAGCIEDVKNNAERFYMDFVKEMTDMGSDVDSMRIRIVVFRDYGYDDNAMVQSPFFELPADIVDFKQFLDDITAEGGGDANENGLEALYYAMQSDFYTGNKDRQVIVLFTDADALELGERRSQASYPKDMPDRKGLDTLWACTGQGASKLRNHCKRLVLFAPAGSKYEKLNYDRSVFEAVEMGSGLGELDFSKIMKIIAASASR